MAGGRTAGFTGVLTVDAYVDRASDDVVVAPADGSESTRSWLRRNRVAVESALWLAVCRRPASHRCGRWTVQVADGRVTEVCPAG